MAEVCKNRGCAQPSLTASWVKSVNTLAWKLVPLYGGAQPSCMEPVALGAKQYRPGFYGFSSSSAKAVATATATATDRIDLPGNLWYAKRDTINTTTTDWLAADTRSTSTGTRGTRRWRSPAETLKRRRRPEVVRALVRRCRKSA